jgi:hypothetical protein
MSASDSQILARNYPKDERQQESQTDDFLRELTDLINTTDLIKQTRLKANFCRRHAITRKELADLINYTSKAKTIDLDAITVDPDDDADDDTYLIPGMIARKGVTLLSGDPKVGKTLLAQHLAVQVATGGDFLGFPVQKGRVVIFQLERQRSCTKRLRDNMGAYDLMKSKQIVTIKEFSLEIFDEALNRYRPDFVFIDCLTALMLDSNVSENSKEYGNIIYRMTPILEKHNCACVLIHHNSKSTDRFGVGEVRGSSAIAGACWGQMSLKHIFKPDPLNKKRLIYNDSDTNRLLSVRPENGDTLSYNVEFVAETYTWVNHGESNLSPEERLSVESLRNKILGVLQVGDSLTIDEILSSLNDDSINRKSLSRTLQRMTDDKQIKSRPHESDRRKQRYSLSSCQTVSQTQILSPKFDVTLSQQDLQDRRQFRRQVDTVVKPTTNKHLTDDTFSEPVHVSTVVDTLPKHLTDYPTVLTTDKRQVDDNVQNRRQFDDSLTTDRRQIGDSFQTAESTVTTTNTDNLDDSTTNYDSHVHVRESGTTGSLHSPTSSASLVDALLETHLNSSDSTSNHVDEESPFTSNQQSRGASKLSSLAGSSGNGMFKRSRQKLATKLSTKPHFEYFTKGAKVVAQTKGTLFLSKYNGCFGEVTTDPYLKSSTNEYCVNVLMAGTQVEIPVCYLELAS